MIQTLPDGRRLILASTSMFRRQLLERLRLPFQTQAPTTDETPRAGEQAPDLVARLAELKARSIGRQESGALIIGSDQVAVLDGDILGKPGNHQRAVAQLTRAADKTVTFHTGLCLLDSDSGRTQVSVEPFQVVFRPLQAQQIETYLCREQPYNCAGSFKSEGLGIALFERLQGTDPNTLIGLPLIRLVRMLEAEGIALL